ncbi:PREDICTED: microfibrillar-associated protein 5 [Colobus angolensis palliatus]|uniref:microfibrillar-associated protein 5 n=1 Tax=Colobus angolensis palliatus TaxID=336983 RepID=UPI0005F3C230|nr:PREDICTED: microfibrillar-associated protein 5 [Colobus angolensis palliatus]
MDNAKCKISSDLVEENNTSKNNDMSLLGPKVLLFLAAFIIPSDWIPLGVNSQRGDDVTQTTPETFTEDPNLVNDPATDETENKFSLIRKSFLRRMYIVNKEICSRLVCKEHEAMKDELCRQMAGLPPRRLRRSNYFRLPPCENVDLQRLNGL